MDKSWLDKSPTRVKYLNGVVNFVKFVADKVLVNGMIYCPSQKCRNDKLFEPDIIQDHLECNGIYY